MQYLEYEMVTIVNFNMYQKCSIDTLHEYEPQELGEKNHNNHNVQNKRLLLEQRNTCSTYNNYNC